MFQTVKQLAILLDLDDVLNNQNEVWVSMLNQRYGRNVAVGDITDWDMRLAFPGLNDEEIYGPAYRGDLISSMKAPSDAVTYTNIWHANGHELYVVTSTSAEMRKQRSSGCSRIIGGLTEIGSLCAITKT